jgi:hypothetical protein
MKTWNPACALSLALGLLGAQAGCSGTVEPVLSPGDGVSASSKPDAGKAGGKGGNTKPGDGGTGSTGQSDDPEKEPSGIGTQVFALCSGTEETPSPRLLRLLTRREYQNTLADLLSAQKPDIENLPLEPRVRGFDNNAAASVVTNRHVDEYMNTSDALVETAVAQQKGALLQCQPSQADCAKTFVQKFGLRAFRRPLSDEEVTRYVALFAADLTGGNFDEGMKLVMKSMLVSPNFLYRAEVGDEQADGTFQLSPYEIASELSYLYWGSMPDQNLFDAAGKDQLGTKTELEAQARRLLADNRASDQLQAFSLQWLRSDGALSAFKDKAIYPDFNDSLRNAMIEEQKRFVTDVALTRDGKFSELFAADFVYANGELASFYGLTNSNNDYSKVTVTEASQRGGILGLGAVLVAQAHSNESSPIKRGLFVRDRLLCQDLPPPPANLDTTPPGLDPTLTTRVRFAKHTQSAACSSCHQYIDDVGFGFEGFDGVGKQRTVENGMPVDTSGNIRGLTSLTDKTDNPFDGTRELSAMLAESATAQSCLTLQYYRFARGYEETKQDACSLDKLKQNFEAKDLTVKELLVNLALLDSFTVRRGE